MNSRKLLQQAFGLTLAALVLTGCGRTEPTATPTNTPTATPTNTPTATPTNTPTATPTPIPPTSTFTPVPPTATPEPFVIKNEAFEADYKGECNTDVEITAVEGGVFSVGGTIAMRDGRFTLWCYGAKHTWIGELVYADYTFASEENDPLQFVVDEHQGYVYVGGRGIVTLPDGAVVKLPR